MSLRSAIISFDIGSKMHRSWLAILSPLWMRETLAFTAFLLVTVQAAQSNAIEPSKWFLRTQQRHNRSVKKPNDFIIHLIYMNIWMKGMAREWIENASTYWRRVVQEISSPKGSNWHLDKEGDGVVLFRLIVLKYCGRWGCDSILWLTLQGIPWKTWQIWSTIRQ